MNMEKSENRENSGGFFSRRRQFLRVLALDWRQNRIDILWGVFYVLIGFYLGRPRHLAPDHLFINAPFTLLGGVMAYLTMRLCYVERREKASVFFFNLPRERVLAWQAHVTL